MIRRAKAADDAMSYDPSRWLGILKDEFAQIFAFLFCPVVLIIYYLGGFTALGSYIIVVWLIWIASIVALGVSILASWARR
jgi:hypothetical protein